MLRRRCAAWTVDTALGASPLVMAVPVWLWLHGSADPAQRYSAQVLIPVAVVLSLLVLLLLAAVASLRQVPTVGQRLAGIRLVGLDGLGVGRRRRLARDVGLRLVLWGLALVAPPLLALDAIWGLLRADGRTLRDHLCATHVRLAPE